MKRHLLGLLFCLLASHLLTAQNMDFLDSLRLQFQQDAGRMRAEFEAYEAKALKEYEEYINSIKMIWGTDTAITDTKTEWVEYSPDMKQRSIVNFENGEVTVEIAVDPDKKGDSNYINALMAQAIERMLTSRGSTCPYPSEVDKSEPITVEPILENLVDLSPYEIDTQMAAKVAPANSRTAPPAPVLRGGKLNIKENKTPPKPVAGNGKTQGGGKTMAQKAVEAKEAEAAERARIEAERARIEAERIENERKRAEKKEAETQTPPEPSTQKKNTEPIPPVATKRQIAKAVAEQSPKTTTQTTGTDGKKREVVQVKMHLVSDNIPKNAALYKDLVQEFSNRFGIEQPLIYAIMEQESAFNPQARSHMNAIGLMQIVPRTAGIDAYTYVYKQNRIPEISYLFNPRNNIELGTAYLRILANQFSKIDDESCRQLCMIASYNTGAGNVSRSFIGTTQLYKALPHINGMDYDNLYNHMVKRLPEAETRDYVKKVTQKRGKYLKK